MPISKGNQPINTFVKGIITEASPLTFPENASIDESNFKLLLDGSRERRLGLDLEDGYAYVPTGLNTSALPTSTYSAFYWPSPSGSKKVDIGVIQTGKYITFINLLTSNPSANVLNGGTKINTGVDNGSQWQFAVLNNYLLAVNPSLKTPYLVSYNDVTDVISYETAPIKIRDLYGVDDNIGVGQRPTTLTDLHKYNLRNQGWSSSIVSTCGTDAIDCTFSTFGVYPSNSDQWGIGRVGDLTDANVYKYDPNQAKRNIVDGGQVPRGTYIIDLFDRGSDRQSFTGLTVPLDRETTYVSTIAAYAGRAWYSGIQGNIVSGDSRSPNLSNAVLYSQIFRNKTDLVKCYQEADPTSYQFNEVVDTDGGVIFITEAVSICKIMSVKQSLFVFAKNGVWEIRGGQDGFTATTFQVNKISSVGVYAPNSIVEANGTIFFWGIDGIYSISPNPQNVGQWDTNNITLTTIKKLYNSIPDVAKRNAKGFYDFKANKARWLYTSDYTATVGDPIGTIPSPPGNVLDVEITGRFVRRVSVCALDETTYVVACMTVGSYSAINEGDLRGFIVKTSSASSDTITSYTPIVINNTTSKYISVDTIKLTSTKFVVVAQDNTDSRLYGIVCDVSGTTITPGSRSAIPVDASPLAQMGKLLPLTSSTFFAVWTKPASLRARAVICSVSGTTITPGTEVDLTTTSGGQRAVCATNTAGTYTLLSDNKLTKFTISGSVITPISTLTTSGNSSTATNDICKLDDISDYLVSYTNSSTSGTHKIIVSNVNTMAEIASLTLVLGNGYQAANLFSLGTNQFAFLYASPDLVYKLRKYTFDGANILFTEEIEIGTELGNVTTIENSDVDVYKLSANRIPMVMATHNLLGTKTYASTYIYRLGA